MGGSLRTALALAVGALLAYPAAAAAVPANDDYAAAQTITTNSDVAGDNAGATAEAGEPTSNGSATVWFSWTAPATEMAQIPMSTDNLAVSVYTASGAVPPFANLVSVSWTYNGYSVVGGTTYKIQVAGSPLGQPFTLRVSDQLPVITFDSGPGTTTDSTPTWDFHAVTAVNHFDCEILTPGFQVVQPIDVCDPPWTAASLTPSSYLLRVFAASPATPGHPGEQWVTERPFTIKPAPPGAQPPGAGTFGPFVPTGQRAAALKQCQRSRHKAVKKKRKRHALTKKVKKKLKKKLRKCTRQAERLPL